MARHCLDNGLQAPVAGLSKRVVKQSFQRPRAPYCESKMPFMI